MAEGGGRQRVFFKCKYCKVLFNDATSLVAHKRFEHADQLFGKNPNNKRTDMDPIRSADEKSPSKIRTHSPPVFSAKIQLNELPGPSTNIFKIPGISSNRKSDTDGNARLKCRFFSNTLLNAEKLCEHERIHTGEKPYQCQHCLKGFTGKSAAETHEKKCPVLEVLKSEVKQKEKKPSTGHHQVPSKNGVKPSRFAHFISVNSKSKNSDYLKKRISYTRNVSCKICHKNIKHACNLAIHLKIHERSNYLPKHPADCFPIVKTEKVPFVPQLLKCIGSKGQVNFSCQKCNKKLTTRCSGWTHLQTHFGKNVFTCPVCNETFPAMKEIVAHFNRHSTNVTSALEDTPQISAYLTHFLWATRVRTARHNETDKHFAQEEDLERGCKLFKCKLCHFEVICPPGVGRLREFRKRMRLHVSRRHTETDLYKCHLCHRVYAEKRSLQKHICRRRISPRRNIPCPICQANIKYPSNLPRHIMKIHGRSRAMAQNLYLDTKAAPECHQDTAGAAATVKTEGLRCHICAIDFESDESLSIHKDGHSKMPFLCTKCGLWFHRAHRIKRHLAACVK